ncbi:MAG: DUF1761 domain-containing protein [Alphaproteobacteria bacterium]|nr:DUF1761 domain-containing protein [Alphaproteobacteria bacterium]
MEFTGINYLAVLGAAVAAFMFGAAWYGGLSKQWMAAMELSEPPKPNPMIYALTFVCQLVIAWVLAGVMGHLSQISVTGGMISAFFVWLGFVATTLIVNHRFQDASWSLTIIDGGHWLGVLMIMGIVIGLIGT